MVLRELIAKLVLDLDRKNFDAADQKISGLTRGLEFAGKAAIALGAGISTALGFAVNAAADANETLNLMGIVFEGNRDAVTAWADEVGAATGRSVFELRDGVTVLGNALKGMTGDLDGATAMAQNLAGRAVDFGSAMNVALDGSEGAINKFLSALAGETEPLRRFGINMNVAALEAFRLEKGLGKAVSKMSEAEKTQLRYDFLMEKTAQFQGDAANTSEAYANATRALQASLKDLGIRIGMQFLPAAEKTIRTVRDVVNTLGQWVEHSRIVQAALIVFGAIGTAVALRMAAAWALANLPILLAAAALAALVLIVDDFLVFLEDGDSVIGRFIDAMWGPGSASEAAANFKDGLKQIQDFWVDIAVPAIVDAANGVSNMFDEIGESLIRNEASWLDWSNQVRGIIEAVDSAIGYVFDNLIADFKWMWQKLGELDRFLQRFLGYGGGGGGAAGSPDAADQLGGRQSSLVNGAGNLWYKLANGFAPKAETDAFFNRPGIGGGPVQQTVNVTVQGNATAETARRVATDSAAAIKGMNREARAALTQRAAG